MVFSDHSEEEKAPCIAGPVSAFVVEEA